jgi:hypothetical protein
MKSPVIVIALASLSITLATQMPASASPKQQGAAPKYTSVKPNQTKPTVPVQAATVRQDATEDGTEVAIRLQDAHHGDGAI